MASLSTGLASDTYSPEHAASVPRIRIEPPRGLLSCASPKLARELLYFFVWRDVRYVQADQGRPPLPPRPPEVVDTCPRAEDSPMIETTPQARIPVVPIAVANNSSVREEGPQDWLRARCYFKGPYRCAARWTVLSFVLSVVAGINLIIARLSPSHGG